MERTPVEHLSARNNDRLNKLHICVIVAEEASRLSPHPYRYNGNTNVRAMRSYELIHI